LRESVVKLMIKVYLAQPRGFCAGVERAIDIVQRALIKYGRPVYVRHEIVHNRHVVDGLRSKGAVFVEELSDIPDGAVTIFSAHGVPKSVVDEAFARKLPVIDATCPLVSKVHSQGRRYARSGRTMILVGHAGHPEVDGTMGQVGVPMHLISNEADALALDLPADTPLAYVTQTTLSVDDTRSIIDALQSKFSNILGPDVADICYATQNRQSAVRNLCKLVDVIFVVGAHVSSNSNRLREIGVEHGLPSYLIADGHDLEPAWIEGVATIGITAGASTPEELVAGVLGALRRITDIEIIQMGGVEESLVFHPPASLRSSVPADLGER
jgi:4-hydroxy-3-methylbut-2-en-1-yl diphosphate reductase